MDAQYGDDRDCVARQLDKDEGDAGRSVLVMRIVADFMGGHAVDGNIAVVALHASQELSRSSSSTGRFRP